jgi:hypothetical protein
MKQINKIVRQALQEQEEVLGKGLPNVAIVNSKDLMNGEPWSAEYHIGKKVGKEPYIIQDFEAKPVEKRHQLKDAVYLTQQEADELNVLGAGVRDLVQKFNHKKVEILGKNKTGGK